ncbi:predicted protein [Methanosarcina acetivorans C2A]|uniref:Uncharacterized protein n=1 Tax=Methanosarcina acetivorans (strain ATCC 35395 / DSM 2834 / JCM 12185 / C2A) TaxID=188937 RepID=Q8TSD3_METAC|nr:predicted protein [Methanosarcina acetivorans C2A]
MLKAGGIPAKIFKSDFPFHGRIPLEFSVKWAQDLPEFNRALFFPNKMEVLAYLFFYFFYFSFILLTI